MTEKGYLALVLHSHLPYVRHPEDNSALEEDWLYEAITETYIPLINVFNELINQKTTFKLTLSLSPTLISMLTDNLLQSRYSKYLDNLIELSEKEINRTANQPQFNTIAKMYNNKFKLAKKIFNKYNQNLINAFKELQDFGVLEVITCTATHGYLPLMNNHPEAIRAQIRVGIQTYQKNFHQKPKGLWLPECGYHPGIDKYLWEEGIRYFFLDTHGILNAKPKTYYANFAPIYCPSGVAAFARDEESSKQVWSSNEGYPGDYDYREFYRDIGFDLDYEYIKNYIHPEGFRKNTGIKYYKITGNSDYKEVYQPKAAGKKADIHAANFLFNRQAQINHLNNKMDRPPIIVSPYDTELFGHWWYEGPIWLKHLLKQIYDKQNEIKLITPSQYLDKYPVNQVATPSLSSWGAFGYNQVWLDDSNDWIYPPLHEATEKMIDLANQLSSPDRLQAQILNQLARELLLAQSSDWAFIMKTNTMKEYAIRRTNEHLENFNNLVEQLTQNQPDLEYLKELEEKNNIFPNINYRIYQSTNNENYKEVSV
ncbi:glycoside hydrolase family 57 protein [Orenia marismortui]|uniref:1,4-alpha-glucan branching enzyme n=1 Tax=Orenia marismortui TaxID=46469 RepID=A0A4V3GWT5_9FIRM|nr:1,4-alpha-glucan branching protein domain-containing protein [Orenia marismortui]TDX45279.1 1,4-alpha-glucan branching enzyme [Orenia marismortui]